MIGLLAAAHVLAQPAAGPLPDFPDSAPPPAPTAPVRSLEVSFGAQHLSDGYGAWRDVTATGRFGLGPHVLRGEASAMRRFGADGAIVAVGDSYTFDQDWYGSLAVGAGDGAFYLPRVRVDAALSRKLLADRNLVLTVGPGYYHAPDGHTDRSLLLGATYYFTAPWILEGGVRFNASNPGGVHTRQQFVVATWGRHRQDLVVARHTWGSEGYLTISSQTQLVNFRSRETNLSWRHWVTPQSGAVLGLVRYSNPLYLRTGVTVGVFHDF
jgi:YaiO family outer membrane protein